MMQGGKIIETNLVYCSIKLGSKGSALGERMVLDLIKQELVTGIKVITLTKVIGKESLY